MGNDMTALMEVSLEHPKFYESFTSAIKQRKGDFEQADNGTLFLDEIGDMSLAAQAKVPRGIFSNA